MIKTQMVTINGKEFIKTYSDKGCYIQRDGVKYSEAVDPTGHDRPYVETDELIEQEDTMTEEDKEYAEAGRILLGVNE